MENIEIKKATLADIPTIKGFIMELAVYEKLENEVVVTDELLIENIFTNSIAHCVLAFENERPIGFALYFYNYSTFIGRKGLYLEDLYVQPNYRGKGYGKKLLLHLVQTAKNEHCGRMEWSVLKWNQSAIDFYESLGAKAMEEWLVYRLDEKSMQAL
jgi:GNAT superfamily N-acetyltransferase